MFESRLAHRALEGEHLVRQVQRRAVPEIDLKLGDAVFMGQRFNIELLLFGERVDILHHALKFVQGVYAEGAPGLFLAARAPYGRFQGIVGVRIGFDQVEFDLRRHHGPPAFFLVESQDAPQHMTGRDADRVAIKAVAVVDDAGGGVRGPGHLAHGLHIRPGFHIRVAGIDALNILGVVAGDCLAEQALSDPYALVLQIARRRDALPLCHAGEVGN